MAEDTKTPAAVVTEPLQIHVNLIDGAIVLTTGKPTTWLRFSPKQARALAELLLRFADDIDNPPPEKPAS